MALPRTLIDPKLIYLEPAVREYARGREVLARFPDAELVEVASHWKIAQLADPALAEDWLKVKRDTLVLGIKKGMAMRPNGRSADFIAPSSSNGCTMACAYCYVGRRKGYANPISVFVNIDDIARALARHAAKLGPKPEPNTIDPVDWVYDLSENGDLSVDASLSDNVRDLVAAFRSIPDAKGSFATKYVNRDLLDYDPQGRTRIRFSLMPETIARIVDVRSSLMSERIAAINDFVDAGYEVHVNFSPVIVHEAWETEWKELFADLDAALSSAAKEQLKCEVIFLTHNEGLHDLNLQWHPAPRNGFGDRTSRSVSGASRVCRTCATRRPGSVSGWIGSSAGSMRRYPIARYAMPSERGHTILPIACLYRSATTARRERSDQGGR